MKTIQRIKQFIDYKGISFNAFDEKIGSGNGYIGKQIKRNASIGSDVLEKIFCAFPEINPIWLLTGDGEMLKDASKSAHTPHAKPKKLPDFQQKEHIAPSSNEGDGRNSGRILAGKEEKSPLKPDVLKQKNEALERELLKAKDDLIAAQKKQLDMMIEQMKLLNRLLNKSAPTKDHEEEDQQRNRRAG